MVKFTMVVFSVSQKVIYLACLIIGMLVIATWIAQQQIETNLRKDVGFALQTVLDTSHQAIKTWATKEQATANIWANEPKVRQLARVLLAKSLNRKALISSKAQAGLRKILLPVMNTKKYQGYFIISRDGVSLASSRRENIGTLNLLANKQTFINKILAGESAISLPQVSDVPLFDKEGKLFVDQSTMFAGAPILDNKANVLAIFVFRINPSEDFTTIFNRGRIGLTGETYAFNKNGWMISNSRFETKLLDLGLLKPGQRSMLNIRVKEPVNSDDIEHMGSHDKVNPILNLMARQAVMGQAGKNLEGYVDYRGVKVIGAWLWDDRLDFGITTEIDYQEAYKTRGYIKSVIYVLTSLAIILFSLLTGFFLFNRKRILDSENQFRKVVDNSPYPIAITELDGNIRHFNNKFIELFGWTINDIHTPEEWWSNAYPDKQYQQKVRHEWESAVETAIATGKEIEPQYWKLTCKNGEVRDVEFRMVSISQGFNVIAMHDLTKRLKTEQEKENLHRQLLQAQKMEAIGLMTGGIAHDFNNMLASIQGYTELAKEVTLSDNQEKLPEYLDEVLQVNERASQLVAQMLAYSRSNHSKLSRQSLPEILHNALSMLKPIMPSSIQFHVDLSSELPDVLAEPVQLQQVIVNLCLNARDEMSSKGQITIGLKEVNLSELVCDSCHESFDGSYVEFSVSDSGEGIEPEVLHRIFDPFFTTKKVGEGSGMGLSIVHGIVHDHNGHIMVQSKLAEGTTFRLFFCIAVD